MVESSVEPSPGIDNLIRRFWEQEICFEPDSAPTKEDCEAQFMVNLKRFPTGKYSVCLPLKL